MKPAKIEANFMVFAGAIRKDSKNKLWHSFALEAGHSCREFAIKSLWTSPQEPVRRTTWIVKNGHVLTLNHSDQTALSDLTEIENEWIKVTATLATRS